MVQPVQQDALRLSHRPVAPADIETVCRFVQDAHELFFLFPKATFPLTPDQLQGAIAQRTDSTVVEADGAVAAFANFYRWQTDGQCAIGNVIVAPAYRGRGVGRYLIEQMVARAFAAYNAAEIRISCFHENVAGLLLYTKLGFRPVAIEERPGPSGRRLALIHLSLPRRAL